MYVIAVGVLTEVVGSPGAGDIGNGKLPYVSAALGSPERVASILNG